jgi:serine/threonine protein kinase
LLLYAFGITGAHGASNVGGLVAATATLNRIKSTRLTAIGRYRLLASIGQGGMAEVFLASLDGLGQFNKLVAVKILRPELAEDERGREMFLNEARLAARLSHPNVVQTLEVGERGHDLHIVMEFLEGQSFARVLQVARGEAQKPLPVEIGIRILVDLLAGLHHAHELREYDGSLLHLVHRDVSPGNVFVTYDGQVKVLDFGIAKAISSEQTREGILKGKVGYLAPEQLSDGGLDRRVDVYAAGVILWELLAGRRVWKGLSDGAALMKLASEGVPAPRSVRSEIPEELDRICRRATARDRSQRYATAQELAADLETYLETCGRAASSRAVARWMAEAFGDIRAETTRLIERQLARAKELPSGTLDAMVVPETEHTDGMPALPQAATNATGSVSRPQPVQSRSGAGLVIGIIAVCAFVGAAWVIRRPPVTPVATATPAVATTVAPAPEARNVTVRVIAKPPTARISIDGVALVGNPAEQLVPIAATSHVIRITADGYANDTRDMVIDRDTTLDVALSKLGDPIAKPVAKPSMKKGAAATPTSVPVAAAPPPVTAAPSPAKGKAKTIDEENPFAH